MLQGVLILLFLYDYYRLLLQLHVSLLIDLSRASHNGQRTLYQDALLNARGNDTQEPIPHSDLGSKFLICDFYTNCTLLFGSIKIKSMGTDGFETCVLPLSNLCTSLLTCTVCYVANRRMLVAIVL